MDVRERLRAFTLLELLVVIGVVTILIGLILPAVQQTRARARQIQCANNIRQLAVAIHNFEAAYSHFPSGKTMFNSSKGPGEMSWMTSLLPFVEKAPLWQESMAAYSQSPTPYLNPPHSPLSTAVPAFACPEDGRVAQAQSASTLNGGYAGLTSYVGVVGVDFRECTGIFGYGFNCRFRDITDGSSNTLMIGERPPTPDFNFGWWYTGMGQDGSGNADMFLGAAERVATRSSRFSGRGCPSISTFKRGRVESYCDGLHFWSLHSDGAHFAFADGAVRLMSYSSSSILPDLATRSGGEITSVE